MTMKKEDFFNCETNHITMIKRVCVRRQTEGVQIDSSTSSIPECCRNCDQGKQITAELSKPKENISENIPKGESMPKRKRGTCGNCERPDLALSSLFYCGTCNAAYYSAKTPEGKKKAMADAKARLQGRRKGEKKDAQAETNVTAPETKVREHEAAEAAKNALARNVLDRMPTGPGLTLGDLRMSEEKQQALFGNPFSYTFSIDDVSCRYPLNKWHYPLLFLLPMKTQRSCGYEFRYKVWGEKIYLMETRELKEG